MTFLKIIFTLLCGTIAAHAQFDQKLITQINSKNYVTGEKGFIAYAFFDRDLDSVPPEIVTPGLNIQKHNIYGTVVNHHRVYVYVYSFAAVRPGTYTIPSVSFDYYGKPLQSEAATINVIDRNDLHLGQQVISGKPFTYYSYLFTPTNPLYPGESAELEYKIYLPESTRIAQWGPPTPEKVDNGTAWRFTTPNSSTAEFGQAILGGREYRVGSFNTVFSGIEPGQATIGKISSRIIAGVNVTDPRLGTYSARTDLEVTFPESTITIKPFPETPPKNFNGAVGNFLMETTQPTKTDLKETDTIRTSITISGKGNLPNLDPPTLIDTDFWELIDTSRVQQGEERKEITGNAEFNFILRPKPNAVTTPHFEFTFFDPSAAKFTTLKSPVIPVTVESIASISTPVSTEQPKSDMKDILGPIDDIKIGRGNSFLTSIPTWTMHILPASILVYLLGTTFIAKHKQKKLQNTQATLRHQALKNLETKEKDFLKSAGAFIQRWLPNKTDPALTEILNERDNHCYIPGGSNQVSPTRKKEILTTLKKFSVIIVLFSLSITNIQGSDALEAWKKNDYSTALELYQKELNQHPDSADLQFNIANCYYRLKEPGKAALFYERSLHLNPDHHEAAKNLEFLHRQQASILPNKLEGKEAWIATFTPEAYLHTTIFAFWITLICIAILYLKRPRTWKLAITLTLLLLTPLVFGLGIYAQFNHPNRKLSSVTINAVIISKTPVLTEPITPLPGQESKKTITTATPGSPCNIIAKRGSYTYIQLANDTRGWIPTKKVEPITY